MLKFKKIDILKLFTTAFTALIISSCSNTDNGLSNSELIRIFTEQIQILNTETNLIVDLTDKNSSNTLDVSFEDGSSIKINSELVAYEVTNWTISFNFQNDTSLIGKYLANEISISYLSPESSKTPLSKEFEVQIPYKGMILWKVHGRNGPSSDIISEKILVSPGTHNFFVHGLYLNGETEVSFEYLNNNEFSRLKQSIFIEPISFIENLNPFNIDLTFNNLDEQRFFLFAHRAGRGAMIVDHYGDVRYYLNEPVGYGLKQTDRGTLIWGNNNILYESKLNGETVWAKQIPDKYGTIHHDIIDMGNDQFLLTVGNTDLTSIEDVVILYDAANSIVLKEWDLNLSVPKTDFFIGTDGFAQTFNDWFHINALEYIEEDNSILVSGQRAGVVKLSWENDLIWYLTDIKRFQDESLSIKEKILSNQKDDVIAWGQHNIRYDQENKIYYLFDNGLGRNYSNVNTFSRGVKFQINEQDYTYEILETYGAEYPQYYSPIISGIHYNDSGNVLNLFGSIGYKLNYVSNKEWIAPVWKDPQPEYGAVLLEYDSIGNLILELKISSVVNSESNRQYNKDPGVYRAEYVDITP